MNITGQISAKVLQKHVHLATCVLPLYTNVWLFSNVNSSWNLAFLK